MPAITLKNIPDDLYSKIKENAALNHRSINSEIIYCLETIVKSKPINPELFLARIDRMNQNLSIPPLTDEFLKKAKDEGRP